MVRPRPARPPPLTRLNISKMRARSSGGMPGPWSGTADLERRRPRRGPWTSTGPAPGEWRSALSSRFGEDLGHQHLVDLDQGEVGREIDEHPAVADGAERLAARRRRSRPRCSTSGRSTSAPARMRVMSSRLATSRSRRSDLQLDQLEELVAVGLAELEVALAQGRDSGLDRCEWRAQIVGHRAHQGVTPAVDLFEQLGPQRLGRAAGCARWPAPHGWRRCGAAPTRGGRGSAPPMASSPTGRLVAVRATEVMPPTQPGTQRLGLAGSGDDGGAPRRSAAAPVVATTSSPSSAGNRTATQRGPNGLVDGLDHDFEQVRQRAVADQHVGEHVEPAASRLSRRAASPRACCRMTTTRATSRRRPRRRCRASQFWAVPTAQRVVGRDEEEVVGDEAGEPRRRHRPRARRRPRRRRRGPPAPAAAVADDEVVAHGDHQRRSRAPMPPSATIEPVNVLRSRGVIWFEYPSSWDVTGGHPRVLRR